MGLAALALASSACAPDESPLPVVDGPRLWTLNVELVEQADFNDPPPPVPEGAVACEGLPGDMLELSATVINEDAETWLAPDVLWAASQANFVQAYGIPELECDGFPLQISSPEFCVLGKAERLRLLVADLPVEPDGHRFNISVTAIGALDSSMDADTCAERLLASKDLDGCFVAERHLAMGPQWRLVRALHEAGAMLDVTPEILTDEAYDQEIEHQLTRRSGKRTRGRNIKGIMKRIEEKMTPSVRALEGTSTKEEELCRIIANGIGEVRSVE